MSIGTIYGKDSLNVLVPITDQETGQRLPLTGATLVVAAKNASTVVAGTATAVDEEQGEAGVSFAAGSFEGNPGEWTFQLRVTKGAEVQTVVNANFTVAASISVPV